MSTARTILIVDDEAAIRRSLHAILADRFNVVACADGTQAIQFASRYVGEIYAAFVDFAMPAMDGNHICSALRSLDPTISLIGFSGIDDAPFQGPLFGVLSKKNFSTERILTLAVMAVNSAEQMRRLDCNGSKIPAV